MAITKEMLGDRLAWVAINSDKISQNLICMLNMALMKN